MMDYQKLRDMMCKELEEITEKGQLSAGDIDVIEKLTTGMKNTYKIEGFEGEGGMSHAGGWEARGIYGRDDGMNSNSSGMSSNSMYAGYDRGNSYRRGHYVRGHYSRDDGMRDMAEQLDGMMNDNSLTAGQKDALRKAKEALMK